MTRQISIALAITLTTTTPFAVSSKQATGHSAGQSQGSPSMQSPHDHGAPAPAVTFTELVRITEQLTSARHATAKYRDVRVAEREGYRPVGPNVAGMGVHYVRESHRVVFSITEPPILLYERDAAAAGGLRLAGVSYLLVGEAGDDGQPSNSPFPNALVRWHKHNNVCVLADHGATVDLTETQCTAKGGRFTAETSWMVHAWIWTDSPAGVFSPTNPLVK